jgi:hypothetical protein
MRLGSAVAACLVTGMIANGEARAAGAEIEKILGTHIMTYADTQSCPARERLRVKDLDIDRWVVEQRHAECRELFLLRRKDNSRAFYARAVQIRLRNPDRWRGKLTPTSSVTDSCAAIGKKEVRQTKPETGLAAKKGLSPCRD